MKNTTPNANIRLSVQDIEIQHGITDLNEDLKLDLQTKETLDLSFDIIIIQDLKSCFHK